LKIYLIKKKNWFFVSGIKFSNTRQVLEDIGIQNPTFDDCAIVQHICRKVSKRAAQLAGAGI
jgi:hypothetical protein